MAKAGSRNSSAAQEPDTVVAELSFSEAQTALELALAQLQAPDLAVESMGELYQRARSYAERCEQLLNQVEQSISVWDPQQPETAPQPMQP